MIRLIPVASGSSGNCMFLHIDEYRLLIDLGVTAKALFSALGANSVTPEDIDAVLITHTHSDHIKGLEVCMKKLRAPLYMSSTSKNTLLLEDAGVLRYSVQEEIVPGLKVTAFPTSHDCPGSVGFLIETQDTRFGYVTDLGVMTDSIQNLLAGCDCIVIESNHDEEMLRYGRYPFPLKRRILSDSGHLSNDACAQAIAWFIERGTMHFLLAHLSRENNRPALALECAVKASAGTGAQIDVLPVAGEKMMEII